MARDANVYLLQIQGGGQSHQALHRGRPRGFPGRRVRPIQIEWTASDSTGRSPWSSAAPALSAAPWRAAWPRTGRRWPWPGRDEGRGGRVVADIEAAGGRAAFIPCDAGSRERLAEARDLVLDRLGEPAVLVNAAGGQPAPPSP